MAKSIGTLKAMLVLDSKGFIGGFDKASNATQKASKSLGKEIGGAAAKSWLKWTAALKVAKFALKGLASEIMKYREVSPTVNAAVESLFDIGRTLRDSVLHPLLDTIAPAFTFVFESALDSINMVLEALGETGVTLEDIGTLALATGGVIGNSFKVMAAGVESTLAMMEELTSLLSGGDGIDARARGIEAQQKWLDAMGEVGKILGGDLSGIKIKNAARAFVPKEVKLGGGGGRGPDLAMPALERNTNDAMAKIMGIQGKDASLDIQKSIDAHLGVIERNTAPKRGGDTLELAKLGGR